MTIVSPKDQAYAKLAADVTDDPFADPPVVSLATLLPGGIKDYDDLSRVGFTRKDNPELYDPITKRLIPFIGVKAREQNPMMGPQDVNTKFTTYRQVVEIWFYDDGDRNYDRIDAAKTRVYALLQDERISDGTRFKRAYGFERDRAAEASNARVSREDYAVVAHLHT